MQSQDYQEKGNNQKKEIIQNRDQKTMCKINVSKSWFFENVNKIDTHLAQIIKKEEGDDTNQQNHRKKKKGNVKTDSLDMYGIINK